MAKNVWNKMYDVDKYKIHDLMIDKEMNMTMLSKRMGASDCYVSSSILGKGKVSVKYLAPLCRALGVKKEDILLDANEDEQTLPFDFEENNGEVITAKEHAFNSMLATINAAINDYIQEWVL